MRFQEILQRLLERDPAVTHCFFFWKDKTIEELEEIRRKDPHKAAQLKKPICNTCRPLLLRILHDLYAGIPFNYDEKVNDLYLYLISNKKLEQIKDPDCLMGWLAKTAYLFFLNEKKKECGRLSENDTFDALVTVRDTEDIEDADERQEVRQLVRDVLASLPNHTDAVILDKALDILQYTKKQKILKRREVANQLGISVDAFNTAFSRAKKQFKIIAEKM